MKSLNSYPTLKRPATIDTSLRSFDRKLTRALTTSVNTPNSEKSRSSRSSRNSAESPIFWYENLDKERKDEITNVIEDSLQSLMVTAEFEKLGLGVADAQQFLKWHFGNQLRDKNSQPSSSNFFADRSEGELEELEADGEWIKCEEAESSANLWYNTRSLRIVFDTTNNKKRPAVKAPDVSGENESIIPDIYATKHDLVCDLLTFDNHENGWNFDNDRVRHYRSNAAQQNHAEHQPSEWDVVYPRYFSTTPLPPLDGNRFFATVLLPQIKGEDGDSAVQLHHTTTKIKIEVEETTALQGIEAVMGKIKTGTKDPSKYMFKVLGREEYIYGDRKIADYGAIREAVRNADDVIFALLYADNKEDMVADAAARLDQHKSDIDGAYSAEYQDGKYLKRFKDDEIQLKSSFGRTGKKLGEPVERICFFEHNAGYRIRLCRLANVMECSRFTEEMTHISVRIEIWVGSQIIPQASLESSRISPASQNLWGIWLSNKKYSWSSIPVEATMTVMVYGHQPNAKTESVCLAWTRFPVIDQSRNLVTGKKSISLWDIPKFKVHKDGPKTDPYKTNPFTIRGTTVPKTINPLNESENTSTDCKIELYFDEYTYDIVVPHDPSTFKMQTTHHDIFQEAISEEALEKLEKILQKSALENLTEEEKTTMWSIRESVIDRPEALPFVLQSCNYTNWEQKMEMRALLDAWTQPDHPEDLLELLDCKYPDPYVRGWAVRQIFENLDDSALAEYLLQLVQCVKYELYHVSDLAENLLIRAIRSPYQIGHFLFWHLKAEFHDTQYCERFGLMLEEYLLHAFDHVKELCIQQKLQNRLCHVAEKVFYNLRGKKLGKAECEKQMREDLENINKDLPQSFQCSLNPRWKATKIIPEKCRYMSSKKVPLWLTLQNFDEQADDIVIMFKAGDDLRQDMLTLQIFTIMDKAWLEQGYDLRLKPYRVIATGVNKQSEGIGMLQIVRNSTTINDVSQKYGGSRTGAFQKTSIMDFILEHNTGHSGVKRAIDNFSRSCAGYLIATYVTGIGDRHTSNIMITKSGSFFHIDFGHFLGNFKTKMGFQRERSPFVFTPAMKHVMEHEDKNFYCYETFVEWCIGAFSVLRHRHRFFCNLFGLMIPAGMPELTKSTDIHYLFKKLSTTISEKEAAKLIKNEIDGALGDTYRLMDAAIHMYVHM